MDGALARSGAEMWRGLDGGVDRRWPRVMFVIRQVNGSKKRGHLAVGPHWRERGARSSRGVIMTLTNKNFVEPIISKLT